MKLVLSAILFLLIIKIDTSFAQGDHVYMPSDEIQTSYPGGEESLVAYLDSSLYDAQVYAKRKNVEGTVYVFFVVEKDGKVSNIDVLKGIHKGIDKMVIKAFSEMPLWLPANLNGKPCRVRERFGIKFLNSGQLELEGYKKY